MADRQAKSAHTRTPRVNPCTGLGSRLGHVILDGATIRGVVDRVSNEPAGKRHQSPTHVGVYRQPTSKHVGPQRY